MDSDREDSELKGNESDFESDDSDSPMTETSYEDGAISKKILTRGSGYEKPDNGAEVSVHYVGTLADGGEQFDSSRDRGEPFKFKLGEGSVIKGWDIGVKTMKKGEKSLFTIKASHAYGARGSPPKIPGDATLNFEIELLSWTSYDDLNKDGTIMKRVDVKGDGWKTSEDAEKCTVTLVGRVQGADETFLNTTTENASGIEFDLLSTEHPEGLVAAIQKMKKGEKAHVLIKACMGYGEQGSEAPAVPPNSDLEYDITLVSFDEVDTYSMKAPEKLARGTRLKEAGNNFFRINKLSQAKKLYEKSKQLFKYESKLEGENKQKADDLVAACESNLAAIFLKQGEYAEAIKACNEALKRRPETHKALLRRAHAHAKSKDWEQAKEDLEHLMEKNDSKEAQRLLVAVKKGISKERQAQAKLFGGMFDKIRLVNETNTPPTRHVEELEEAGKEEEQGAPAEDKEDAPAEEPPTTEGKADGERSP